jgi:hypothetical protein
MLWNLEQCLSPVPVLRWRLLCAGYDVLPQRCLLPVREPCVLPRHVVLRVWVHVRRRPNLLEMTRFATARAGGVD